MNDLKINFFEFKSAVMQRKLGIAKNKKEEIERIIYEYENIDSYRKFEELLRKTSLLNEGDKLLLVKKEDDWLSQSLKDKIDPNKTKNEILRAIMGNTNQMIFDAGRRSGRTYINLLDQDNFSATLLILKDYHDPDKNHFKIISIDKLRNNHNVIADYLNLNGLYSMLCEGWVLDRLMDKSK